MLKGIIAPVEERTPIDEFTDRVELLRELDKWVKGIDYQASSSTSIIAPRRLGKTSLLDRLVNNVFFNDYNVAPFYFNMERRETTLRSFLLNYATTFFRQYIAYCIQDPILYKNIRTDLKALLNVESEHYGVLLAQDSIRAFLERYNKNSFEDAEHHWGGFIYEPELIASYSGTKVAVIIDEIQDMKFFVYNSSEKELTRLSAVLI
jgi:AAA+ ATPase superfamily predicted ATPase